jgi:hypothetical protein
MCAQTPLVLLIIVGATILRRADRRDDEKKLESNNQFKLLSNGRPLCAKSGRSEIVVG